MPGITQCPAVQLNLIFVGYCGMHIAHTWFASHTSAEKPVPALEEMATKLPNSIGAPHSQQAVARSVQSASDVQAVTGLLPRSITLQLPDSQVAKNLRLLPVAHAGQATGLVPHAAARYAATSLVAIAITSFCVGAPQLPQQLAEVTAQSA